MMNRDRRSGFGNRNSGNMIAPFIGGISPFTNNSHTGSSDGPLSTDHFQLRELDLELALLKRKREIIEKQQQMLSDEQYGQSSRYSFDEPQSYNRQQYDNNSSRNYSHLYDSSSPMLGSFGRQQGTKRQADNSWQSNSAPKRFVPAAGPRNKPRNKTGQLNQPKPKPLMGTNWPKPVNQPIPKSRNDITPTKVSKPKNSNPSLDKLKSLSNKERRQVQRAAATEKKNNKLMLQDVDLVLHSDKPPSIQVKGRMELALGAIYKDAMDSCGEKKTHVPYHILRDIKQSIRDRIRSVMMDKFVGASIEVIKAYREVYTKESDNEMVMQLLESQKKTASPADTSADKSKPVPRRVVPDNPGKYFKIKFNKMLHGVLADMFTKLDHIYKNDKDTEDVGTIIEEMRTLEEKIALDSSNTSANKTDDETKTSDDNSVAQTDESVTEVKDENVSTVSVNDSVEVMEVDNTTEGAADKPAEMSLNDSSVNKEDGVSARYKAEFYDRIMMAWLRQKLPNMLQNYKEIFANLISVNKEYTAARNALLQANNETAQSEANAAKPEPIDNNDEKSLPRHFPYFVKVMGKPTLPKKNIMQEFLHKYNPCSIKKHKAIDNLLFVSFKDKDSFEAILADNDVEVGGSQIEIKPGEKSKQTNEINNDDVTIIDNTPIIDITDLDDTLPSNNDGKMPDDVFQPQETAQEETVAEDKQTDNIENLVDIPLVDKETEGAIEETEGATEETEGATEERERATEETEGATEETEGATKDTESATEETAQSATEQTAEIRDATESVSKDNLPTIAEETGVENGKADNNDVGEVKEVRTTRTSARLAGTATPSTIRTRRSSKLGN